MIDHNTRRVLFLLLIIVFLFWLLFQAGHNYCDYCSCSCFYYYKSIILVHCFPFVVLVPGRSQVITLRKAIVTVAGDNILDGL
jgi:hypothetical protein